MTDAADINRAVEILSENGALDASDRQFYVGDYLLHPPTLDEWTPEQLGEEMLRQISISNAHFDAAKKAHAGLAKSAVAMGRVLLAIERKPMKKAEFMAWVRAYGNVGKRTRQVYVWLAKGLENLTPEKAQHAAQLPSIRQLEEFLKAEAEAARPPKPAKRSLKHFFGVQFPGPGPYVESAYWKFKHGFELAQKEGDITATRSTAIRDDICVFLRYLDDYDRWRGDFPSGNAKVAADGNEFDFRLLNEEITEWHG